ncbi:uncharacterized protein FA14DRAFT_44944 [Meira miltonrushii]|uniref:Uncharacterized protein n=1 Tax=Meira miltonrushii TaxID=1280837 RepID=A0A316VEA7_9BASI|nr:uncharacterized protein FA14DRAFT_44944 [Meira miltonrushii]PWN35634.1 hypothetical protein FA14DRAFT_44944 [Meira miltonrushii]
MVIGTTHFFIDLLLITTFKQAQGDFQHFYLFVHFICLIFTMLLMTYGFAIIHKPNYHAICNFRSWTLLLSMFLGFSGSFASLGFALDWTFFHQSCMENVYSASVAAALAHMEAQTTVHKDDAREERFDGESVCKETFDGLLCTQLILYVLMQVSIVILFLNVNSFKATRFEKEDKISAIRKRKQLAERNKRLGVRPKEEGDEVEGINVQDADIEDLEEMEKGKGKSVTFAKQQGESPISDSDMTNFMSSPSTDHERSPPVEGFLGGEHQSKQPALPPRSKQYVLPHFHLPHSSPFAIFRTPKSSMNATERNHLFQHPESPFSATIPTPPPVCSPLQGGEDEDAIVPISPFEVMQNRQQASTYSTTRKKPYQQYDRHATPQQEHPIPFPVKQSNSVPKIIVDYYDQDGKVHTEDPIKRALKAFTASKDK